MDDNLIIRRIQGGEVDAFARLVEKYHGSLLAFIHRLVRDPHLTEDIGQEVFLNIYKSLDGFDPGRGTPFSAWLYISARNRCISELRRRGRGASVALENHHRISAPEEGAEALLIREERRQLLAASLDQLPEPFRTTIQQSLQGLSHEDIARQGEISPATVKSRLFRAREKLKQLMRPQVGGVVHER